MTINETIDEPRRDPSSVSPEPGLSLLSLTDRSPAADRPLQVASLAGDLSALAASSALGCDVLFGTRQQCENLSSELARSRNPGSPAVGNMLSNIMEGGQGPIQMRVDRLNDYLRGEVNGPRTGFTASYSEKLGRITLTENKTGNTASYELYIDKKGNERVNPRPVAQSYRRR